MPRTRNIKMFEHKNETTNFEMETIGVFNQEYIKQARRQICENSFQELLWKEMQNVTFQKNVSPGLLQSVKTKQSFILMQKT